MLKFGKNLSNHPFISSPSFFLFSEKNNAINEIIRLERDNDSSREEKKLILTSPRRTYVVGFYVCLALAIFSLLLIAIYPS